MEKNMNNIINRIIRKNELYHHGILGQKWGVRRYQNTDGSYTTEGKKRRAADGESTGSKIKSDLRKAQHIADRVTIINSKLKPGYIDTYDNATKGPMGSTKSRRQTDYEAQRGISGNYEMQYNQGKKVRDAEAREKEFKKIVSNGQAQMDNATVMNMMNQQFMNWTEQETMRNAVNAGNMAASLSLSGGATPFMFGIM